MEFVGQDETLNGPECNLSLNEPYGHSLYVVPSTVAGTPFWNVDVGTCEDPHYELPPEKYFVLPSEQQCGELYEEYGRATYAEEYQSEGCWPIIEQYQMTYVRDVDITVMVDGLDGNDVFFVEGSFCQGRHPDECSK